MASSRDVAEPHPGAQTRVPPPAARSIDAGGIGTRYYDAGAGETIVFIYGGSFGNSDSASSAHTWNRNLLPLAGRLRVIAFDKIGQGFTDNPGPGHVSIENYAIHDKNMPLARLSCFWQRSIFIAARQPVTQFHALNRAGSLPLREQPDAFSQVVAAFCGIVFPG